MRRLLKVGDLVSAVYLGINMLGDGKRNQAKVIELRANREEVFIQWVKDKTYSRINLR